MYFLVAGLSIKNLFGMENGLVYQVGFYAISIFIFGFGIFNFFHQKKKIDESRIHIGNFQGDYLKK